MSFRQKLDTRRLLNGGLVFGAIALAWVIERPRKPASPVMDSYPAGWTVAPEAHPPPVGILRMRWPWWRAVLLETYEAMSKDRLLAVAAGVVFYGLLAIFPAITALVSSYGLFAKPNAIQDNLSLLANVLPAGGISIIQEQIERIASQPSGLSIGFAVGLMIALWSANAGVKAMIDALNVIEGQDERRTFVRLNALVADDDARRHRVPAAGGRRRGRVSAGDVHVWIEGLHRHDHLADPLAAAARADDRRADGVLSLRAKPGRTRRGGGCRPAR